MVIIIKTTMVTLDFAVYLHFQSWTWTQSPSQLLCTSEESVEEVKQRKVRRKNNDWQDRLPISNILVPIREVLGSVCLIACAIPTGLALSLCTWTFRLVAELCCNAQIAGGMPPLLTLDVPSVVLCVCLSVCLWAFLWRWANVRTGTSTRQTRIRKLERLLLASKNVRHIFNPPAHCG